METVTGFIGLIALVAVFVSFMVTMAILITKQPWLRDKKKSPENSKA